MTYIRRKGIVLLHVCEADLMVATRQVWEECPPVRPVPRIWAVIWKMMEDGKSDEEIITSFSSMLTRPEKEVRERFITIFEKMADEGYLIRELEKIT